MMLGRPTQANSGCALVVHCDYGTQQDQVKLPEYKQQAKLIFRRVTAQSEPRCSIESGACTLQ